MRFGPAVQLIRAVFALCLLIPGAAALAEGTGARFLGQFTWQSESAIFGGLSAIEVTDGGNGLLVVSDRGRILRAELAREGDSITGITETSKLRWIAQNKPDLFTDGVRDAEGLAMGADGRLFVSFEGTPRILEIQPDGAWLRTLPLHPELQRLQRNSGMEALAIDGDGRLLTIPERSGEYDRPFPVWLFRDPRWEMVFRMARDPGYLPVGADFGPDGLLYVLERGFNGIGFRSRVRRFAPLDGGVQQGQTLMQSPILSHDNLEGLSVWRDAGGRIRLTMISDDNFRRLQRTEIVEYVIDRPL